MKVEINKRRFAALNDYKAITVVAMLIVLFFGFALLSPYLIMIAILLVVIYVMLELKIESMEQFELLENFLREYGKRKKK